VAGAAQESVEEAALRRSWRLVRVILGVLELLELGLVEGRLLVSASAVPSARRAASAEIEGFVPPLIVGIVRSAQWPVKDCDAVRSPLDIRPTARRRPAPGEEARRSSVAPDEAEIGGRVRPRARTRRHGERPHPQRRRARKPRGEELRVASDELSISFEVADNPATEDPIRPVAADGDGQLGGFGPLAVRAPDRRTEVAERVPALDEDQDAGSIVTEPDVGRTAGIRWPGPELEGAAVAGSAANSHHELLDREMSGVGRLLTGVAP
jgi:hypothetical protein